MPKILIIRFSSIGDIVLTSPVVRCLKKQLAGAEVHFLTKDAFKNIMLNNPYVDKVYSFKSDVNEVMQQLKAENYNYIIDLQHNLRSLKLKAALRAKSFSFKKLNIEKWLVVNFKMDLLPPLHIVDRYVYTLKPLGVVNDNEGLDFFINEKDEVDVSTLPETHSNGYIGFVIGAKHFTKRFPDEKIIEVCRQLNKPVILLGGPEDAARGNKIVAAVGSNIYNACGKYSLGQSASLIKQARLIISNDTGLMHIAAAFKKNIISVWGNTIPEFGMAPYLPTPSDKFNPESKIIEVIGLNCRPCSKIGFDRCPKGHFKCMNDLIALDIIVGANELLQDVND